MSRIAIIGAGSWGTALAIALARRPEHSIALWAYEAEVVRALCEQRENTAFLPGFALPDSVSATSQLGEALDAADFVVTVMPSQHVRRVAAQAVRSGRLRAAAGRTHPLA